MRMNLVTQGPKKICASFLHEQKYPLITYISYIPFKMADKSSEKLPRLTRV